MRTTLRTTACLTATFEIFLYRLQTWNAPHQHANVVLRMPGFAVGPRRFDARITFRQGASTAVPNPAGLAHATARDLASRLRPHPVGEPVPLARVPMNPASIDPKGVCPLSCIQAIFQPTGLESITYSASDRFMIFWFVRSEKR